MTVDREEIEEIEATFRAERDERRTIECFNCGNETLEERDDLTKEVSVDFGLILVSNLKGGRCSTCGHTLLNQRSSQKVQEIREEFRPGNDYGVKVTPSGSNQAAIYIPKDVLRQTDFEPGLDAFVQPLSRRSLLIQLPAPEPEEFPTTPTSRSEGVDPVDLEELFNKSEMKVDVGDREVKEVTQFQSTSSE